MILSQKKGELETSFPSLGANSMPVMCEYTSFLWPRRATC